MSSVSLYAQVHKRRVTTVFTPTLYPLPHVHVQRLLERMIQQGLATRDILAIEKNQAANSLGNKNMDNEALEFIMVKKINDSWVDEDKRRKNRASLRKELEWIGDGDHEV